MYRKASTPVFPLFFDVPKHVPKTGKKGTERALKRYLKVPNIGLLSCQIYYIKVYYNIFLKKRYGTLRYIFGPFSVHPSVPFFHLCSTPVRPKNGFGTSSDHVRTIMGVRFFIVENFNKNK